MIPVSILTGFLGAGKTTFLNRLLRDPALFNTAIIINEFGDVALDHLLVERSDDDVIELSSGCLCCTVRGELLTTLERLFERPEAANLNMIIIETTGLADPVPVMQAVMMHPVLSSKIRLGAVVSVVDAVNGARTLETYTEAVRQVAVADRLVLSKCDLLGEGDVANIQQKLAELNPVAALVSASQPPAACLLSGLFNLTVKTQSVQSWFGKNCHDHHSKSRHRETIRTFTVIQDHPVSRLALMAFIDLLTSLHGPSLLRVKGLVKILEDVERPVLLQGVQNIFHPPEHLDCWPDKDQRTRLVFITDGLDQGLVQRLLDGFCEVPGIDTPDRAALMDNPLAISNFSAKPGQF